jgi:glycosyltransferase involved in cell wall biosynthesis
MIDDVSIVIATLGGKSLIKTLSLINNGTLLPKEILICSPTQNTEINVPWEKYQNVKFLHTKKMGQVAQRVEGLICSTTKIVIQMDDDIFVEKNTIERLVTLLQRYGPGHAISPIYCDEKSKNLFITYKKDILGFLKNIIDFVIFGSKWGTLKMGTISKSGVPFYFDFNFLNANVVSSDWLPGGMVICYRENLIFEDYFPFDGKAYFEDVIHSIYWKKNRIKLIVCNETVSTPLNSNKATLKQIYSEHQIKMYINTILNKNNFYCYTSTFYSALVSIVRNFVSKI